MNTDSADSSSLVEDAEHIAKSAEWLEHEHVSEQIQIEAQKLVDLVGSSELAKNAIDVAAQRRGE